MINVVCDVVVQFTKDEEQLYERAHRAARAQFDKAAGKGTEYVNRNLLAILSLLSPLRAICSGGRLHTEVNPGTLEFRILQQSTQSL